MGSAGNAKDLYSRIAGLGLIKIFYFRPISTSKMAMPEMDDLLDQLEEEVEKERRLKQKEQAKGNG